jgi:4-amino-4-deoxy-L-arabinose transferase-like glycosyltransferase
MKTDSSGQLNSRLIFAFFALYFLLQIILRIWISHGAELDEAEQLILSQQWRWGYGSQPPLYTWLLMSLSSIFGMGIITLATLKNLLLFTTYLFTYLSAREITRNSNAALVAMASLLLIPQIAWESQRDLTHSVLVTCCSSVTFFVFLRLLKSEKLKYYLLFGFMAALGAMSKYNFFIFLAGLLLAALSTKRFRKVLLSPKILLSLLIFLSLLSPHLTWTLNHQAQTFASARKFGAKMAFSDYGAYSEGLFSLALSILAFLGPLLGVYLLFLLFKRKSARTGARQDDSSGSGNSAMEPEHFLCLGIFLRNYFLSILLICAVPVFIFQVTEFKDRWMQPLFFVGSVYLSFLFSHLLDTRRTKIFLALCAFSGLCVLTILPLRTFEASSLGSYNRLNLPYEKLASKLRASGFKGGEIFADTHLTGGNLRLFFKNTMVVTPKFLPSPNSLPPGQELVIWDASKNVACHGLPPDMTDLLASYHRPLPPGVRPDCLKVPLRFSTDHFMRLGFILVNPPISAGL